MASFGVPRVYQREALFIGIVIALVFRGVFIALGAAAIQRFTWVFYIFGAFLVYTAVRLARGATHDADSENGLVRFARNHLSVTDSWQGRKLVVKEGSRRSITPMALVVLALGATDLIFALDSIPAIYGLTSEPYLVLAANVFALMGLRQLYFIVEGLLQRLVYLSKGLAVILVFIGVKLILHALRENDLPFINGGKHLGRPGDTDSGQPRGDRSDPRRRRGRQHRRHPRARLSQASIWAAMRCSMPARAEAGNAISPSSSRPARRVGALPLLRGGGLVLGQPQQVLGSRQPLLLVFGKITAPPANRFGFSNFERADVLVYGVAVFELRGPIAEHVVGPLPGAAGRPAAWPCGMRRSADCACRSSEGSQAVGRRRPRSPAIGCRSGHAQQGV